MISACMTVSVRELRTAVREWACCFVFAIFDAVVIVSLSHFNSWMEAWRCGFKFLKSKSLARIGQQNRPLNMALKALLRTCVYIYPSLVLVQPRKNVPHN